MSIPDVQKAWVSVRRGSPSQSLEFRKDWPVSKNLQPGMVLVKIQAAALNPVGYKVMKLLPRILVGGAYVAEHDFAGVIVDANGSGEFEKGDQIYGWIRLDTLLKTKQGALAEYIQIPEANIVKRPSNITPIQAAGVTLTALTALQALNDSQLEEGQSIFIYGGGTAVGHYAIQLAKIRGAKVTVAASGKNENKIRNLGADEFVDYTNVGPLHTYLAQNPPSAKYNVVLDAYGLFDPSLFTFSKPYLAPNGIYVTVGPQPHAFNLTVISQALKLTGAMLLPSFLTGIRPKFKIAGVANVVEDNKSLQKYIEEGKVKPAVDSVFEFEDTLNAYERIMSGKAQGKVTIKVDPSLPSA